MIDLLITYLSRKFSFLDSIVRNPFVKLGNLLFFVMIFGFGGAFGYSETMETNLGAVGVDIYSIEQQKSVSRYEVARLLNATDCKDCLVPDEWMEKYHNQQFWTVFSQSMDFNFGDILFRKASRNQKNYYYCVAYVADNEYLRGYPSTSALGNCKNKFCGGQAITKSEFLQAILNLVDNQIFISFDADRKAIKDWFSSLQKTSYQYQVLTTKDIQAIQKAGEETRNLATVDELGAYMRYCMFHLEACGFQEIAGLKQGWRPISELNVLMKSGIITTDDAKNLYDVIDGKEVLKILDYVNSTFVKCSPNDDYDCDGIKNVDDNCPNTYNPHQRDLDGDGVGNVCDADIDGDGSPNPLGVVDDDDHVIISQRDNQKDQSPLGIDRQGFDFFINVNEITNTYPKKVTFKLVSSSELRNSVWQMGDGKKYTLASDLTLSHTYTKAGTYVIRVVGTDKSGKKAEAMMNVYLAPDEALQYGIQISPSFTVKNAGFDYSFIALTSGNIDRWVWTINNQEIKSSKNTMITHIQEADKYVVRVKAYRFNQLQAVGQITLINDKLPLFASLQVKNLTLQGETQMQINLVGKKIADLKQILRDFGDGTAYYATGLNSSHQYQSSGLKTVRQILYFVDGKTLEIISTIFIKNPLSSRSIAMNLNNSQFGISFLPSIESSPIEIIKNRINVVGMQGVEQLKAETVVNRCVSLFNQGETINNATDFCFDALKNGKMSSFKCDLDKDGIPDLCDDDIDGDGKKNLLGLILKENDDCSFDDKNVDLDVLKRHFGVCSLDNCPFTSNNNQYDGAGNGIGDACEIQTAVILSKKVSDLTGMNLSAQGDLDGDGVLNGDDGCPQQAGPVLNKGCPIIGDQTVCDSPIGSSCGDGKIDDDEDCQSCPEDVGECTSICGDGIVDPGETCKNCSKDVPICGDPDKPGTGGTGSTGGTGDIKCGNGVIDEGETCKNCAKDVQRCSTPCGNGKIDKGEECDDGAENGKNGKCSFVCKKIGNGTDPDTPGGGDDPDNPDYPDKPGGGDPDNSKIETAECNVCPCEFVDYAGAFLGGDLVRAKFWDKPSGAFYGFSSAFTVDFKLGG
ncbi:hypothetical protein AGMMS50249_0340 [candidate division SR1 bacterium]|nr:hypothetical protein AGMMS50249_0340 [candidate division SR1 bacterium]